MTMTRKTWFTLILWPLLTAGSAAAEERALTAADAAAGRALYVQECGGCHGDRGDGAGPAAAFLDPAPRNFVRGQFKFRTTASGQPPATADVLRTIERGIPGTAMPSFAFLTAEERRKIAAQVLKLIDILDEPEPETVAIDVKQAPPATPEAIARGKELYADAGCASCHGELGKGDGAAANDMKDEEGRPVKPRDLTVETFRGGGGRADLFYRLTTGIDGTPMPAYADVLEPADRWAVVDYVLTLHAPPPPKPLPADALEAGRLVADKYSCRGCHVLDDGKGGDVGPDLRVSGEKLDPAWVEAFLRAPREYGKIYPWRPYRMPHLGLSDDEAAAMARYIAHTGGRQDRRPTRPEVDKFPADRLEAGKNMFVLTCAQCHALGKVVETPLASQQGPDLIRAAERVDYDWAKAWISDPRKIDPKTKMVIPGLKPEEVDAVRMFIWAQAMNKGSSGSASASR